MLSTQQAVSEIETTEHVKTGAGNADDRNSMVVRPTIVDLRYSPSYLDDGGCRNYARSRETRFAEKWKERWRRLHSPVRLSN